MTDAQAVAEVEAEMESFERDPVFDTLRETPCGSSRQGIDCGKWRARDLPTTWGDAVLEVTEACSEKALTLGEVQDLLHAVGMPRVTEGRGWGQLAKMLREHGWVPVGPRSEGKWLAPKWPEDADDETVARMLNVSVEQLRTMRQRAAG